MPGYYLGDTPETRLKPRGVAGLVMLGIGGGLGAGTRRRGRQGGEGEVRRRVGQGVASHLATGTHSHTYQTGSRFLFLSDAKDPDQLGRNKITHIISIHESPQPLIQVLLTPIPGLHIDQGGSSDTPPHTPIYHVPTMCQSFTAFLTHVSHLVENWPLLH